VSINYNKLKGFRNIYKEFDNLKKETFQDKILQKTKQKVKTKTIVKKLNFLFRPKNRRHSQNQRNEWLNQVKQLVSSRK